MLEVRALPRQLIVAANAQHGCDGGIVGRIHAGDNLTEEQRAQTTGMPVHTTMSVEDLGARFTGDFPDRDNFEAAVRRVSKKSVRWS